MNPFTKLTVCLDMHGCPNRCDHCWLAVTPNGNLQVDDLRFIAKQFRPFTKKLEVYDWYREPDYSAEYQQLRMLCTELSDEVTPHFELASYWRIVRDQNYLPWLYAQGVREVQLTLFGAEAITDRYIGRKGAYQEILRAIDLLFEAGITPRIQLFLNQETIPQLPALLELFHSLRLEERCHALNRPFHLFAHLGSCDGENRKHYTIRLTEEDLSKIPEELLIKTKEYLAIDDLHAFYGVTEEELYQRFLTDDSTKQLNEENPVFYVDHAFFVYPNLSAPAKHWCLGNLKQDDVADIVSRYQNNQSIAQQVRATVPLSKLVSCSGNAQSRRLFDADDYIVYLLNEYCIKERNYAHQ